METNEKDMKTIVLDYENFSKLVFDKSGLPKDRSVFDRIRFFGRNDFNYLQRTEIKPYFVVMIDNNKIVGLIKIGQYSNDNFHQKDYSISFFSIDIEYRNKGLSKIMADCLFSFAKENNFELKTSSYTYVGKIKLQKLFNNMAEKWQVKFTDKNENDYLIDHKDMYNENLFHIDEIK